MESFPQIPEWITLEHQVAEILTQQQIHGWYFDEKAARELESTLRREYESTTQVLRNRYPYVRGTEFTPKRSNKRSGYVEGAPLTKLKEFNPTSRDHISWILQTHYGWTPSSLTNSGKAVIDETVLKDIGTDIALQFLTLLTLTKQLGMISEGVNAWQKLVTTSSRIHHHCSVATATFRCAHRSPNLGQVPSDERFRRLFTASPNMRMAAADLSGIELRMLAHYLGRYDGGRYARVLLEGDIHQENADKIGISRKQVKTVTYAFLYGAGDIKIGHSYDKQLSETQARKKGKEIREAYVGAIDGLKELLEAVHSASERGYVLGLDKRKILVDKQHKSLNYLLQGSAAIVAKKWMVITHDHIKEMGLHCNQLAFVHDELQFESVPEHVDDLKSLLVLSSAEAGEYYNMRIPVAAEAKDGETWADTH
jgi:DNA polymerase I-like protein with 3'-5' exonuclease and polymerase domains